MSDVDFTIGKTMVILAPLQKSDEIKSILIEKKVFQNKFRPQRFSDKLALPIKDDYGTIYEKLCQLFPDFSDELELLEKNLEKNKLGLSPAELVKEEIKLWLQENNINSNNLLEKIPKKWEQLGNLVLLPD